jgi:hypothetical protein
MNMIQRYNLHVFIYVFIGLLGSCGGSVDQKVAENPSPENSTQIKEKPNVESFEDCLPELKSLGRVDDQLGSIYWVGETYVILTENEAVRYHVCNLPESYKITDLNVTFSIIIKEVPMNAKMVGLPAVLTKIKINR